MTLNATGPISLGGSTTGQSVNLELGNAATDQISFNDAAVRTLTGTSTNTALVMPTNFYGKSKKFTYTGTMTQAVITSGTDTYYGYDYSLGGSLSPAIFDIIRIYKVNLSRVWYFYVTISGGTGLQNYWTTLTLGGTFSINSSSATAFYDGNNWEFANVNPSVLTGSGTLSVVFS